MGWNRSWLPRVFGVMLGVVAGLLLAWMARGSGVELAILAKWGWAPRTLLAVMGGTWGALAGILVPRGRGRTAVMCYGVMFLAVSAIVLGVGLALVLAGGEHAAWYPWVLMGGISVFVMFPLLPMTVMGYQRTEARRLQAIDVAHLPRQGSADDR